MHWSSKILAAGVAALLQACVTAPAIAPEPPTAPAAPAIAEVREPVTILVSIDGFHPDYLRRGVTPVLSGLAAQGVEASMRPSFPTKTFPNHYTIVTGLRPDRSGIVANRFEDPERPGETFTMATSDSHYWEQAEPIWVAAERAGIRTATMFWPGSNVEIRDTRPSDWQQFNQEVSGRQRVDAIIDWLRRPPTTRPEFLTLYFDTVDTAGHRFGPEAPETTAAVAEVDSLIGRLTAELTALGQPANLVIVSDHGMAATHEDRMIRIDRMLPPESFRAVETGPYAGIVPAEGAENQVAATLLTPHKHMQCWRREDIPSRLHYGSNPRVPPIICLAELGWLILAADPEWPITGGSHGWDNAAPEMRALFLASGPAFAAGRTLPPFDNVAVEPLLRHLIGLPQRDDIDGTIAPFEDVLLR
ncbi:ectonucleotide pyrophosphatase/phosphodiesterase [Sphingosinithalassobacter sp. LHW66-3]|uniref:alkaline phosphatase family protein n=1 Tax=Sphingosinithalassobacter sp. LHW66-3 TaxID=3424718 RepID=UPI003D6A3DE7